ncbi:hypothetical protein APY04_1913 [Hyphomicrobium sulfonivorans]|uniref:Uncharacterized protein n=1 Tax=Hyphomicrobium sulfonivorans TaxID=121290 RepID=A0A109BFB0_HYPSL|nr:hypothetical protein APY04_1913 [Hyphomicrobium sulfonivorans]
MPADATLRHSRLMRLPVFNTIRRIGHRNGISPDEPSLDAQ